MYNTKKYRYVYACGGDNYFCKMIVKVDTQNKEVLTWGKDGHCPSEPVFIPKPHATTEDDGNV